MRKIIITLFLLNVLFACNEDRSLYYNQGDRINFEAIKGKSELYVYHSMGDLSIEKERDTIYIPVSTMGFLSKEDRKFRIESVETETDTPKNSFAPLEKSYIMKSDSTTSQIPIIFNRYNILGKESYKIELRIESNEYFQKGVNELQCFVIEFDNILSKPSWWPRVTKYMGVYHQEIYQKYLELYKTPITSEYITSHYFVVLKNFKEVKEYFETNTQYGIKFPNVDWPL